MAEIFKRLFFLLLYFKKYVFLLIAVYLLFFTKIFFFVFSLVLQLSDDSHLSPNKFVKATTCKPGGLAHWGDWMLDTLQPMVSDEKMIRNFYRHEKKMVELAALAEKNKPFHFENRQDWDVADTLIKKLEKETNVELKGGGAWGANPYSIEEAKFREIKNEECKKLKKRNIKNEMCFGHESKYNDKLPIVLLSPNFGRRLSIYFCTTDKSNTKDYLYFPGIPPKFQDGYPLDRINSSGVSEKMNWKLTDSTDRHVGHPIMRKITENWYIVRD